MAVFQIEIFQMINLRIEFYIHLKKIQCCLCSKFNNYHKETGIFKKMARFLTVVETILVNLKEILED